MQTVFSAFPFNILLNSSKKIFCGVKKIFT